MDLLTGLVLTGALLFAIGYVVRELAGDSLASFFSEHTARTSEDPNKRLIGEVGEIVATGTDGGMRVRVGIERWHAQPAADEGTLPVGTKVRIAGVDGTTLHVARSDAD